MLTLALLLQLQIPADSYADSATAELVREARAARLRNERLVTGYTVRASQRIGVGIMALTRDRMLWRQELVVDIAWRRDSASTATVVGARESAPVAERNDRLPDGLRGDVAELIIDPGSDYLRVVGLGSRDGFVYPLREGGERDYRYAIGGTTEIGLPDGRRVRLVALEVTPRRADWQLIAGTLWFDADTRGLVRAAFRPARPYELQRDLDPGDREDVPGWVNVRAEVRFVTLEYGLYENRWWLPRYVAIDAVGSMGSWLGVPLKIERVYRDYEVEGGTPPDPGSTFRPAGRSRWIASDGTPLDTAVVRAARDSLRSEYRNCVEEARRTTDSTGEAASVRRSRIAECRNSRESNNLTVVVPSDTAALLASDELGPPILQMGDLITEAELAGLGEMIEGLPGRSWETHVRLPDGLGSLFSRARYNRIEGLSLGAGASADFGRLRLDARARLGIADLEPNGELMLTRETIASRLSVGAYSRLAAANPATRPFGALNSATALLAGRDDGEYFRTRGVEIRLDDTGAGKWSLSAWHQRETTAEVETNASLPRLFDSDRTFRPNIEADKATQTGAAFTLRSARPVSPAVTLGAEATIDGATGDFDFGRGSATLRLIVTPQSRIGGALMVSAGTSHGSVPVQSRYFVGGNATLRGYSGGAASGDAYWLARAELSRGAPAARLIGFADAGWAGSRSAFGKGGTLAGVGIGASFLDGLFRIDVAHGLKEPGGARVELYVDGLL